MKHTNFTAILNEWMWLNTRIDMLSGEEWARKNELAEELDRRCPAEPDDYVPQEWEVKQKAQEATGYDTADQLHAQRGRIENLEDAISQIQEAADSQTAFSGMSWSQVSELCAEALKGANK